MLNFSLNDNFQGVQLDAEWRLPPRRRGESIRLMVAGDIADGRGNAVLSLG
ncbi:hypothetical protein GGQ61_003754 [Phenylobacterium haematophilum]|uniref:Uncharacterized protein n=1 Tax=Phenylobacterium haematophilum TaxID=98513 RepID=A0A840A317_9CAUL|nr:hypothetical protein [Phenylobacterium haematophilum]MBB3893016.1 hypothetical protein [Phenylobacterium haematophilum]